MINTDITLPSNTSFTVVFPLLSATEILRTLQRATRKSQVTSNTKTSFKPYKIMNNYSVTASVPECHHSDTCGCTLTLTGLAGRLKDEVLTSTAPTISGQISDLLGKVDARLSTLDPMTPPTAAEEEVSYFRANIPSDANAKLVPPPYNEQPVWPQSIPHIEVEPSVRRYVFLSDVIELRRKTGFITGHDVVSCFEYADDVPSLFKMSLRSLSTTFQCFGKTRGRRHVISALDDLYVDHKLTKAMVNLVCPTIHDRILPSNMYEEEVSRHFYRLSGIDFTRKEKVVLSLTSLIAMYLGSSNGRNRGKSYKKEYSNFTLVVRPKGKKIEIFEQDVAAIINMFRTGIFPAVFWSVTPKNERYYSWTKQQIDRVYNEWVSKLRLFIIPSSVYILIEKMVSIPRMRRERGRVIRVGHRWPHGGADTIAKLLNVFLTPYDCDLVAGDFKNFDVSARAQEIRDYWAGTASYYDPSDPLFTVLIALVEFCSSSSDHRLTNVIGLIWAIFTGSMASGKYNTSHGNSNISSKEVIRFCLYQIDNAPTSLRAELMRAFLAMFFVVVFGDDHIYNKTKSKVGSEYFSGQNFRSWCERFRGKTIRDMKDGIPFLSTIRNGYVVTEGVTFLKHYFVANPYFDVVGYPNQSRYLPFRETREYMIRAVYAGEVKQRQPLDVLLSLIGHAYGTYASNRDAYDRLLSMYTTIVAGEGYTVDSLTEHLALRAADRSMKRFRQMGLTVDMISRGFPAWDTLIRNNTYDPMYQDISQEFETNMEYEFDDIYD